MKKSKQEKTTKKKPISIRRRKAKARNLQKWVAKRIAEVTGLEFGKDCAIESRPMGQAGTDVRLDTAAQQLFPFSVECKWQETWSVPSWIKQAKENVKPGTDWLLFCKRSGTSQHPEPPVVIMDAEVFFELWKEELY